MPNLTRSYSLSVRNVPNRAQYILSKIVIKNLGGLVSIKQERTVH